jgi:hypothetical protein
MPVAWMMQRIVFVNAWKKADFDGFREKEDQLDGETN